jgi:hypothetical protein
LVKAESPHKQRITEEYSLHLNLTNNLHLVQKSLDFPELVLQFSATIVKKNYFILTVYMAEQLER